jgi:hypothetical protein
MTNGVVSVLVGGKVALKVVCGCNGNYAYALAHLLKVEPEVPPADIVRGFAEAVDFGCKDCLVIQTPEEDLFHEELDPRYRETFSDPEANPRWRHKADYTELVYL